MTLISNKLIDDQDLIARYLANQLSEQERENFEAHFLEHPNVLRELNRTAQFKAGLAMLRDEGLLEPTLAAPPWWRSTKVLAAAASVTALALVAFWMLTVQPSSELIAGSPSQLSALPGYSLTVADSLVIQRTRTTSYDATIKPPKGAAAIELRVRPETVSQSGRYRVTLSRISDGNAIVKAAESGDLRADSVGLVPLYLSSAAQPGVYELRVFPEGAKDAARDAGVFLIEIERAEK